ncbi:MAG: hypothetical protein KA419_17425, partial [Acidobacteria bacterium]|nr:hypothetical protein [Acidobacteriota bacterium]
LVKRELDIARMICEVTPGVPRADSPIRAGLDHANFFPCESAARKTVPTHEKQSKSPKPG